jgi:hypothetical protein
LKRTDPRYDFARQVRREHLQEERHAIHHRISALQACDRLALFDRHPDLLHELLPRSGHRLGLSAPGRFLQRLGIDPVISPERVRPRPEFLAADKIGPVAFRSLFGEHDISPGDHPLRPDCDQVRCGSHAHDVELASGPGGLSNGYSRKYQGAQAAKRNRRRLYHLNTSKENPELLAALVSLTRQCHR